MEIPSTSYSMLLRIQQHVHSDSAWLAFDARYRDVIVHWCRQRGFHGEAEDVTQEVLLKLLDKLPRHVHDPARGRFRAWLKSIVRNQLHDLWRSRIRRPVPAAFGGSTFGKRLSHLAVSESGQNKFSSIIGRPEKSEDAILQRTRARVAPKTWAMFLQFVAERRSAAEIAREHGLTTSSIFKYVYRVKQILLEEELRANQKSSKTKRR